MSTGLDDDPAMITDARKTAVINKELSKLKVDIATLQETRLASDGTLREKDYTFFWQGKRPDEPRIHGVGFAVKNSLLPSVTAPSGGSERLLSLQLSTSAGRITLISAYAPTLLATDEDKDKFYDELHSTITAIPSAESFFLMGDFNARVGSDHEAWPSNIGHFGVGLINDNGQRLLELCSLHDLCITNTFFPNKHHRRVSWQHPRSKRWHQLDMIVTRRSNLKSVRNTRTFHSADCNTDHSLVCSFAKFEVKPLHRARQKAVPKINITQLSDEHLCNEYRSALDRQLQDCPTACDATTKWNFIRNATHKAALDTFGRKKRDREDWFEANLTTLEPAFAKKREALLEHKARPSARSLAALKKARSDAQRLARQCANEYWTTLADEVQEASDTGNIKKMFKGLKKAFGPSPAKCAPLKSLSGELIHDKNKQLSRWVEHYEALYSTENKVSQFALDSIERLPVLVELDSPPTVEELLKAIDTLSAGKAPGSDGIPPEVIKAGKGSTLIGHLHSLLTLCWTEKKVPQDMRDAKIITLYKNKGDRSDCNNYRGISLLAITGKVFARVILSRLQTLGERVYPESQCGFRANRSTIDMVFSLRQLQEKCREQNRPLYLAFIDLTKAFDLVSRAGLFSLLEKIGCPPTLLEIIVSFHEDMKASVFYDGSLSNSFPIKSGVKQGCVLAPTLFGIFFSMLLQHAFSSSNDGIFLRTRSDGKLFNLARLRAKTLTRRVLIRELLFADDAALASHTEEGLQRLVDAFAEACKEFGLTISLKKTQILTQNATCLPTITIDGHILDLVQNFTYLGSCVTDNLSLDTEINRRMGKAAATMARLNNRVWLNTRLTTSTKTRVYNACVLSTLLYGAESWPIYASQEDKLNAFHMRCLRRLLGITWRDKIPNRDVLLRTKTLSLYSIMAKRRLRWLGHVSRMDNGRIPKDLLYGELEQGKRKTGRPLLRFRDACKRDMKAFNIATDCWENLASDRLKWRAALHKGELACEEKRLERWERRRHQRHRR